MKWMLLALLVWGCARSDDAPPPAPVVVAAPAPPSRWLWIESAGGVYLAFYYVDASAGPSAKGAVVAEGATPKQVADAIAHPRGTFRAPFQARLVTPAERTAMQLPARPPWLDTFEPPGTPEPALPAITEAGRPKTAASFIIQRACGSFAGTYWMLRAGESLPIGHVRPKGGGQFAALDDAGVLDQHALIANRPGGVVIEPLNGGKVLVNDKPITAATPLALDDRIAIGATTLMLRAPSFEAPVGPDPSCPGVADAVGIEDGCSMFGTSTTQLIGGDDLVVGTDVPERVGLPAGWGKLDPVRVKLVNDHRKVRFTAVDPARKPKLKGKPVASGVLSIGDRLEVGDRIFIVVGPNSEQLVGDVPLASCPEFRVKAKRHK